MVRPRKVNYTNYATTTNDSHFGAYAIECATVYHNIVVGALGTVRHHGGWHQVVARKFVAHQLLGQCRVLCNCYQSLAQIVGFTLKGYVLRCKLAVDFLELEETYHVGISPVDAAHHRIGCAEPYTALIAVELEQ